MSTQYNETDRSTHKQDVGETPSEELKESRKTKALHRRFYASSYQRDSNEKNLNTYLEQGYLFPATEVTLLAIQVVPTKTYIRHVFQQQVETTECRMCSMTEETTQDMSSESSTIGGGHPKRRKELSESK